MDIFSFRGRANRLQFWMFTIGLVFVMLIVMMLAGFVAPIIFGEVSAQTQGWIMLAVSLVIALAFLWPSTAVAVQRAHDRGASGRWYIAYVLVNLCSNVFFMSRATIDAEVGLTEETIMMMFSLVMLAWFLFFIVTLGFLPGNKGTNRYGPRPGSRQEHYRPPPA